jgi:hypothetical protein
MGFFLILTLFFISDYYGLVLTRILCTTKIISKCALILGFPDPFYINHHQVIGRHLKRLPLFSLLSFFPEKQTELRVYFSPPIAWHQETQKQTELLSVIVRTLIKLLTLLFFVIKHSKIILDLFIYLLIKKKIRFIINK